jgi:asparagine synthase (glutamine-hydrolysing)
VDPAHFLEFIPRYVWYMDEPVTEGAALSLYFIARRLRQHATVALSGEGADELFAGYDIYRYMHWIEAYRTLPEGVRRRVLEPFLSAVGNEKIRKYLRFARKPLEERYLGVSGGESPYQERLYTDALRSALRPPVPGQALAAYYARTRGDDLLSRMLYNDLKTWLVDDLLIKADKMTMANSVELRVPFLDHRVVEYAATIPSALKLHRGQVKWILKQAVHDRLPREILRRKKRGFPTPLALMFQHDLSDYLHDLLLSSQCLDRLYFQRQTVEKLVHEHCTRQKDHHDLLWKLVILEEWHRQFIDGNHAF